MKKRYIFFLIIVLNISILVGCGNVTYTKYKDSFFDTFDTVTTVVGYAKDEEEFEAYMDKIYKRSVELHQLFDKYSEYDGVNNIKTINDNAGKKPVKVKKEIIDLLLVSKEWYYKSGEKTNIAMGPVIEIWSEYQNQASVNPENASIPTMEELEEANKYTDIEKLVVNEEDNTVFLEDPNMLLDVGSVAKGYAIELISKELEEEGFKSALISGGGNIRAIGKPLDTERERWGIGIQNPDKSLIDTGNLLETIFIKDASVVSSGDYQRYFVVDGKVYHHIIDPETLMPGNYYRAMTIVTPDSGIADFLSTSAFLLPLNESKELIESLKDTDALWVMKDGTIETTEGMDKIMLSEGASGGESD